MKIAYHFVVPEPPRPELDGAVQEALRLRERFGGELHFLYPAQTFHRLISPSLAGLGRRRLLRDLDREVDLHHVFLDCLRPLPATALFAKPWIATVLTGPADEEVRIPATLRSARALVVPAGTESRYRLRPRNPRLEVSLPGLELETFATPPPPPPEPIFRLLAGSAPWTRRQFATKGFEALLAAAVRIPTLAVTFLWRGLHAVEARARIAALGLEERAEVIDREVDVAARLRSTHAAVALARRPHLLKAYPHSLLEALAAGRPIVASSCLAIAELVTASGCGVTVAELTPSGLAAELESLIDNYPTFRENTARVDLGAFSRSAFLDGYEAIYRRALAAGG